MNAYLQKKRVRGRELDFNLLRTVRLTSKRSEIIIKIIDMYESEIYGWGSSMWSELIRPALLETINHDNCKR